MGQESLRQLPMSHSILDAMEGFHPRALQYRDEQFQKLIQTQKRPILEKCMPMLNVLKEQTRQAETRQELAKQGASTESLDAARRAQEQSFSEQLLEKSLDEIKHKDVNLLLINYAFGDSGQTLVGYQGCHQEGENLREIDVNESCGQLFNESMFQASDLSCVDGAFYHSARRGVPMQSDDGSLLAASREELERGLAYLEKRSEEKGVSVILEESPFEKVSLAAEELPVAEERKKLDLGDS